MTSISSWICTQSSKNLFVKIVHHGGRVELYDRPISAAELLSQYPKSCVAHPTVFRNPYDIVSSSTTLALGQKYYIVPIITIRRLQLNYIASQKQQTNTQLQDDHKLQKIGKKDDHEEMVPSCWLMRKNNKKVESGKKGKNVILKKNDKDSAGNGGTRLSFTSLNQWHPGLESITEE